MRAVIALVLLALLRPLFSSVGYLRRRIMAKILEWLAIASFAVIAVFGLVGLFLWIAAW